MKSAGQLRHSPSGVARKRPANAEFERECTLFFAEAVQIFGVPKSVGQIYGLLYASPRPLSFSDMVLRLEISKGSASQGLQLLRSLRAIKVVENGGTSAPSRRPGIGENMLRGLPAVGSEHSRRIAYEPELSLRKLVGGVLHERVAPFAVSGEARLDQLRALTVEAGEGSEFFSARVKQLETWRKRFKTALPILGILLGPKSGR